MRKITLVLCLSILLSILIGMVIAGSSMAQDEWQNISAMGVNFNIPPDWEKLDEFIGISEQEGAWFAGDIEHPNAYVIMARGEDLSFFLEIIMEEDDENIELISDENIEFLGHDARSVLMLNHYEEDFGRFILIENFSEQNEDFFMMIGVQEVLSEEFQPVIDTILASFTLEN